MNVFKFTVLAASVAACLGLTACSSTGHSQNSSQSALQSVSQQHTLTYVRTVEGIDEYQLSNGLKVLLFNDDAQPKTLVNITYRVGSVNEYYGETGMAHLLEHMLFKGSTHYPEIDKEFKKRGMGVNATTWLDRTNYFEAFEASPESLEWAIGMEADRMVNATFTEEQLKSEMTVVRNEMERGENDPLRMLLSRMSSTGFLWHNYGNSTIGARSDVERFPFPKLRAFYKKHYRPDNAVLTIAGRFDKEKTLALIESKFGAIAKPEQPIEPLYTVEPTQDGERVVNIRRVGDIPYVGLMYHTPSGVHPDAAPMRVLQQILSDSARGRLKANMVDNGLATSAFAFAFNLKDSSQMFFFAQGEKGQSTTDIENTLIAQAEDLNQSPITDEEIKRAQATLLKQSEMAFRDVSSVGMELSEYIAKGDYRHIFYFRDQVQSVTAEQVQAVAEKYLIRSNRTLGRFIPTADPVRAEIPQAESLDEVLKDYTGKAVATAGEVYDNTVSNIKSRLVESTWPQGTEFMVYPKKLRGDEVKLSMYFPTGTEQSLAHQGTVFSMLGSQILSGNSLYSKADIADKLDALKSTVSISSGQGDYSIHITTDKKHLTETVNFVGELLAAPTFPESELTITKRARIASIEKSRNDPNAIAMDNYRKTLSDYPKGHPRVYMTIDEKIAATQAVNSATLKHAYTESFDISNGYIAVVGDVNAEQVSTQLQSVLGKYTTHKAYSYLPTQVKTVTGQVVSTETPDKANANVYLINRIDITPTHPDYLALTIANSIFGGDVFSSRIGARIRVKEGYSYSVRSGLSVQDMDDQGIFWMMAIAAPENIDKVIKAYKEEVQKVLADGFTTDELERAVDGFVNTRKRAWADDGAIPAVLINNKEIKRDLAFYDQQIIDVKALTVEQVNAAFKAYIGSLDNNVFKAGDFAKRE